MMAEVSEVSDKTVLLVEIHLSGANWNTLGLSSHNIYCVTGT
jgi:hypothetical protein